MLVISIILQNKVFVFLALLSTSPPPHVPNIHTLPHFLTPLTARNKMHCDIYCHEQYILYIGLYWFHSISFIAIKWAKHHKVKNRTQTFEPTLNSNGSDFIFNFFGDIAFNKSLKTWQRNNNN